MDQGRLEELKRLLDERRSNAKQTRSEKLGAENSKTKNFKTENFEVSNFKSLNSEVSNFEFLNSKSPNFATDALNLETKADQNSACKNNTEPQNFTSDGGGALPQNSKARDSI